MSATGTINETSMAEINGTDGFRRYVERALLLQTGSMDDGITEQVRNS